MNLVTPHATPAISRRIFLASAIAAALGPRLTHAANAGIVNELTSSVPGWMAAAEVPGCSIALIQDAAVVWTQGFGLRIAGTDERVDERSVFEAASLTKSMIAYVTLKLAEQGKLDLDAPIVPMLDGPVTGQDPERFQQITARHILSHSSGLPNWRPQGKPLRVLHDPGVRFRYSGEGYALLSQRIERITAQPLHDAMQQRLFNPFGLESASLVWRDDYATRLAGGHDPSRNIHGVRERRTEPSAASSVICTPADFAAFVCAILAPPPPDEFHLRRDSIEAMLTPHIHVADDVDWGLGWGLQTSEDGTSFWHWGNNNEIYHAFVIAHRTSRNGIVVFTNGRNGMDVYTPAVQRVLGKNLPALDWTNRHGHG